ncbi:AbgT family transporter [Brevibacillus brevis]|uniref:AbgT family transporter n=1 Tax=Brevibacillus brevis TaxID=1393 RepID=UPI000D0ED499|nr:AbgT family transporter [Brevibacillus brevis]PSJ70552.1 p-aminobenzoyl-glutamate transporter [Brevibacillus brevis]RED30887.1 aminobenzoyl-glutamate transport protein [Brevibacillus brevis]GEC88856.1 p-aminobenzoyl-glutamate transporter [Brevibacillus brevis]VEF89899.1 Aminobenzoyl-glutamate transport protein [Brevibacillus brevis]
MAKGTNVQADLMKQKGILKWIETVGNKLPHPFVLFIILCGVLMVVSAILAAMDFSVIHPAKGEEVAVKSLLSVEGIHWILTSMLKNFIEFPALGLVLAMTLGIGLAEKIGLLTTVLRKMMAGIPASVVSYAIVFVGILGNLASDAAMVIIPPLGGLVFLAMGRHPIAGFAAGMAGVSSGFTANFFIAGTDALLAGISTEVAKTIDPNAMVTPVDNWFFMSASVVILAFFGGWITDKIIEPRLGTYHGDRNVQFEEVTPQENKALRKAGIAALIFVVIVGLLVVPEGSLLRDPKTGDFLTSPFLKGIIPIILLFFVTVSFVYGRAMGLIKTSRDIPHYMSEAIKDMSGFIVLAFTAAQFIAFFNWSNIGILMAVNGAELMTNMGLTGLPIIIAFTLFTGVCSLFITSGSALWAILAPVFMPMLMLLDYNPAFIQVAYRIADSATNTISPVNPYIPLFLAFYQKYNKNAGMGTIFSTMTPFAIVFLVVWILQLTAWYFLDLPFGPGVYAR